MQAFSSVKMHHYLNAQNRLQIDGNVNIQNVIFSLNKSANI